MPMANQDTYIFKSDVPSNLQSEKFKQCVLPLLAYLAENITLTIKIKVEKQLKVTQKNELSMLGLTLSYRGRNEDIRRSRVDDVIECITKLKWR